MDRVPNYPDGKGARHVLLAFGDNAALLYLYDIPSLKYLLSEQCRKGLNQANFTTAYDRIPHDVNISRQKRLGR